MQEATSDLLADANDIVREQLALAWREHVERVRDVLEAQWPARMERVIEETIAGMAARLDAEYQDALSARLSEAALTHKRERRDLVQKLNQAARRLRQPENEAHWAHTLADATRGFCGRAAIFALRDRKLHLEAARNIGENPPDPAALEAAPAFATAVQTRDTLIALRTRSELSGPLGALLGETSEKCCLIPLVTSQDVTAVLYADSGEIDVEALELLAGIASTAIETRPPAAPAEPLVTISPAQKPEILSWFSLSRQDRELHLRAQRFARLRAAEIRLYQDEKIKKGRTAHDLYTSVQEEIDSAREAFRRDYLNASDSMVDYLHLELVRTLANNDVELLGKEYPGPMA